MAQGNKRMENGSDARWWHIARIAGWSLAAIILLLPLVAMMFTDEVNWGPEDFLFAGILVGSTGLLFELVLRRSSDNAYRFGGVLALVTAFLLAWVNAAVGIVGSGANVPNALYFAVLAIALTGGFAAGFKAKGMSVAMFAAAVAQALVTVLGVTYELGGPEDRTTVLIGINAFFIALWIGAGMLFRKAAEREGGSALSLN